MKEIHRFTTHKRYVTAVLAGIAAIPVTVMVPAVATPSPVPSPVQVDRAGGSVDALSASAPPQLWAPHGCGSDDCRDWGQYNNGCGGNLDSSNRHGCDNNWPDRDNGDLPYPANAMAVI